ncbi:MAG: hydroxyacylglutathione hydrolase [Zetaproteobacteria bacterium]|nr:hydroxyacylglutathione hydrolase [Zetaproteobacteria bacterium]
MWSYQHSTFQIHQLPALNDNYIYLIEATTCDVLAVIDPADASIVNQACQKLGKPLTHILNTHHHWDHTDGNQALKQRWNCTVLGAAHDAERIPCIDVKVLPEQAFQLGDLAVNILDVGGHTLGHIAYVLDDALFCGDALFGAGCGRIFEGTLEQTWQSLQRLAQLDDDTKVYCAHEYTLPNLRFARAVDANNEALKARIHRDTQTRMQQNPTIPSTISIEKATNPFLRPLDADFCTEYAQSNHIDDTALNVFTHLRQTKG